MESVAVTAGTACGSNGNSPVHPATKNKSSTYACIYLNARTSLLWEHQKKDFIKYNHGSRYLGHITDEIFAFHLLQIHAKFCIEQPGPETLRKCRNPALGNDSQLINSEDDDGAPNNDIGPEHEQSALPLSMIIKSEPNFRNVTARSDTDVLLLPGKTSSKSSVTSSLTLGQESFIDASAEGVQHISVNMVNANEGVVINNTSEYMECEEKPNLINKASNPSGINTSVGDGVPVSNLFHAANARGPSEVESHLDGPPDGTWCTKSDRMQRVAIESPDVSHDQQRESVPVTIKIEEGTTCEGDDGKHFDAQESESWLNTEPPLATEGDESWPPNTHPAKIKLDFRQMITKCEDCHKVLRGARSGSSVEGGVHRRSLKCKRCRKNSAKKAGLPSMDSAADIPRQKTYHSMPRCSSNMMGPDATLLSNYSGMYSTSENPGHQLDENRHLAGRSIPSSDVREVTGNDTCLEGETGTCSSRIHHCEDYVGDDNAKDCGRPFKCTLCSETFHEKIQLQRHKSEKSCVKMQLSQDCPSEGDQWDDSGKHVVTRVDERPFSCSVCLNAFTQKDDLTRHMRTHTGEIPFSCSICSMAFSNECSLEHHLQSHMTIHTGDSASPSSMYAQAFSQEGSKNVHSNIVAGKVTFSCDICSKTFSSKSVLKRHMVIHTGERPFSCSICRKAFFRQYHLKSHMAVHTGERAVICKICSKAFTQKGSLTRHMRTHTGERPYVCHICTKAFSFRGNLKCHMSIHTGEKASCNICGKVFNHKGSLANHMYIHTGQKRFVCSMCTKAFSQKKNLKRHMVTHTG